MEDSAKICSQLLEALSNSFNIYKQIWSSDLQPSSPATHTPYVKVPPWSANRTSGSRALRGSLGLHHPPFPPAAL